MFNPIACDGTGPLGFAPEGRGIPPFGLRWDLGEWHKKLRGLAKPKRELTIDDVIPYGI